MKIIWSGVLVCMTIAGQSMSIAQSGSRKGTATFGEDTHFVEAHSPLIILSQPNSDALVAVSPTMQGRVLTSSASGEAGRSFGWVNREWIASGKIDPHFNAFGGEDRIWLGPEGGQFSIFFASGQPFDLAHWFTPKPFDTEPFETVHRSQNSVELRKRFDLTNYSGTHFQVQIDRTIQMLSLEQIQKDLALLLPASGVQTVGYESNNRLTNIGKQSWKKETGLLSLWVLGQFAASSTTTIAIPVHSGTVAELGKEVTTDYFGQIPPERISVQPDIVYFKADSQYRSKVGINPARSKGILGSYDSANQVLTIVQYVQPSGKQEYVNSAWKIQEHPYVGDVINAYNDGPQSPGGTQLGHFYEMETSSPAAALVPGASIKHVHRTFHFQGEPRELDAIARKTLGVGLDAIRESLPQ